MEHQLKALRALEYQIRLGYPVTFHVTLKIFSNGNVFIILPMPIAMEFGSVQLCDAPPSDELLRVHHSIRCWFDGNGFDFDAALAATSEQ